MLTNVINKKLKYIYREVNLDRKEKSKICLLQNYWDFQFALISDFSDQVNGASLRKVLLTKDNVRLCKTLLISKSNNRS